MRPHRVRLTHSLVDNYQLGDRMILQRPQKRSEHQISQFHADGAPRQHHMRLAKTSRGGGACRHSRCRPHSHTAEQTAAASWPVHVPCDSEAGCSHDALGRIYAPSQAPAVIVTECAADCFSA